MTATVERPAQTWRTVVGVLVCVELASGLLQGYYTPIFTDIARHLGMADADVNWFEASQLIVSALLVPPLAKLGDLIGHRRILLIATAATAVGSWVLVAAPGFTSFLVGWAVQGAYVVWLPLEIAIVHRRTAGDALRTRRGAGVLVGFLYVAIIVGAGLSGALVDTAPMAPVLAIPAVAVTLVLGVVWWGVESAPGTATGSFDRVGLGWLTAVLALVMGGLVVVRVRGTDSVLAWALVALGLVALAPFWRVEAARREPLVDVHLLATRRQWPLQAVSALLGMSVLGAQIPLSTFARTDPAVTGYGLGAGAGFVSVLIAVYVLAMAASAFGLPLTTRRLGARGALVAACVLIAIGYAAWLPFHAHTWQGLLNMALVGLGTGTLVAALPAEAAAAAPPERTGFATGMTNATKTVGGAVASAVFAIALSATGSIADPDPDKGVHPPFHGYLVVWAVCAAAAALGAVLLVVSRTARRG